MIIKPKFKGSLLLTAHPEGCKQIVREDITYVKNNKKFTGCKKALIIGASSGYGLASRISLAFGGSNADTIGVSFETGPRGKRAGTAGWHNNIAFKEEAEKAGLTAKNFVGDAFSLEMKEDVIKYIKEEFGKIDLLIYSLASGKRTDPTTGETYTSALKSTTGLVKGPTVDVETDTLVEQTMDEASEADLFNTVKVMGGEDWALWVKALVEADVIEGNFKTYAYSYIGPKLTDMIYGDGTIGAAKRHLEKTAIELNEIVKNKTDGKGTAAIAVNKALVTKASAFIPIMPLYAAILFKVMKEKGIHEGCIEQVHRLFVDMIYGDQPVIDEKGRIRPDNWELRDDVQEECNKLWEQITDNNFQDIADYEGYKKDFLRLGGFGVDNVDYDADIDLDELSKLVP